ncbi:hypothetical protein AYR62_03660 [Secundilactobacillus paracollinoides]|uniref:Uncharacterized protein n=1 Tax=Secundilactobacillus paracollinoides TaxID=240427 RepID=A0A1B2IZR0_9LACO|nr:hypothetical protein AYR61_09945 [Secundilactobacillus paracollinoides]ANZ63286.1 hypothetical protein AYR62_03660 [Secundilactobacillus paracollinoides]ANZ67566.1 hypothetical protein AYR63_10690 [Secundilactobacillus paracollinoides]
MSQPLFQPNNTGFPPARHTGFQKLKPPRPFTTLSNSVLLNNRANANLQTVTFSLPEKAPTDK